MERKKVTILKEEADIALYKIKQEQVIIESLKKLIARSETNINQWNELVFKNDKTLASDFVQRLRKDKSFVPLLNMKKVVDTNADEIFRYLMFHGPESYRNGITLDIPQDNAMDSATLEKFKKMFQRLLDIYMNEKNTSPEDKIIIHLKSEEPAKQFFHVCANGKI